MVIKKILVVEDDMIIQMFITNVLAKAGFEVVGEARRCEQALTLVDETNPDLILMDIGLSGEKDGIETAKLINENHTIPIVFMTGNSDEGTIERAKTANPAAFIFKPIDEAQLKYKLTKLTESNN